MEAKTVVAKSTVCQLYANRQASQGEMIRVRATAWVALRHGGALLQDPDCPKVAIGFGFADDAMTRPKVEKLDRAMTGDVMDLTPRIFEVQVIGVFSAPTDSEPTGSFTVHDVEWFEQRK
ncbi:hypothetical protein [Frateuria sp. Soil773]|uniref:hypothetical protein n=1 Tax=Frateuria sp. Soil773 TaxID=1736407 RepID=UPI0012F9F3FB|nr:hypothetical protein [Frateuria sp. Soil773]